MLEETPVDDSAKEVDWALRGMSGGRRSLANSYVRHAEQIQDINPDGADLYRIRAQGIRAHGDELNLFRITKKDGMDKLPGEENYSYTRKK